MLETKTIHIEMCSGMATFGFYPFFYTSVQCTSSGKPGDYAEQIHHIPPLILPRDFAELKDAWNFEHWVPKGLCRNNAITYCLCDKYVTMFQRLAFYESKVFFQRRCLYIFVTLCLHYLLGLQGCTIYAAEKYYSGPTVNSEMIGGGIFLL